MKKKVSVLIICLMLILFGAGAVLTDFGSVVTEAASSQKSGWVKKKKAVYYYRKGKKVTGWKKIGGNWYYFNGKGKLQKNTIAGDSAGSAYYVDAKGIRCGDEAMTAAARLVRSLTAESWSRGKKLKTVFSYFVNRCRYVSSSYTFTLDSIPGHALRMLVEGYGDCAEGALAMCYAGRVLGYEVRLCYGKVSSIYDVPVSDHAWCEVYQAKGWKVYDISMQRNHPDVTLHNIYREAYPYPLACEGIYWMKVKDGTVSWS